MATHFPTVSWAKTAVIYEVNIRQYTKEGTFNAFREHLPRLKDMGVDILWLMPITPISEEVRQGSLGSYYACSSYVEGNKEFGNVDDLKLLINEAHDLGMKIIIDWVANHTGWDHQWTKEHADWYLKNEEGNFFEKNGWHDVIDLNYDNNDMRLAMIDAMKFWITECNIDGFRCDMAHLVPLDFWKEARTACDTIKNLFWLAECEVVEYHDVFDATYAWWWMHETEKYFKGNVDLNEVRNVLHAYSQYPQGALKLFFTSNHDENSWNGTEYEKYGNAAKSLAVFTFTWNGMPLIYSGQESPSKKRLKFFDKDLIDWKDPLQLNEFYKTLAELHHHKAISDGETFILPTDNNNLFAFIRRKEDEVVMVLLNLFSSDKNKITVEHEWLNGSFENVFSQMVYQFREKEEFELQEFEYIVYRTV